MRKKDVIIKKGKKERSYSLARKEDLKQLQEDANVTDLPALWSFLVWRDRGFLREFH